MYYISRLCYDVSAHLSVKEVHGRIIANLDFKFRFKFTAHIGRGDAGVTEGIIVRRVEGSSRTMLATVRPSFNFLV